MGYWGMILQGFKVLGYDSVICSGEILARGWFCSMSALA